MSTITPIPEGFRTITPHLNVRDCEKTIEFYKVMDTSGHIWEISQRVGEPNEEEMRKVFSRE